MSSPDAPPLRLNGREIGPHAIMAVVNRTPDSFFDRGATYGFDAALAAAGRAVAVGADIVDIGGVKAGPGRTSASPRSCAGSSTSSRRSGNGTRTW